MSALALQDQYAPKSICFGCGPANEKGLRIKSRVEGDEVVADFTPEPFHHAFPNVLNGGIIGALLDCHSNWTAAYYLMRAAGESAPPCTVTADFTSGCASQHRWARCACAPGSPLPRPTAPSSKPSSSPEMKSQPAAAEPSSP